MELSDVEKAERVLKGYCSECYMPMEDHSYMCSHHDPFQSAYTQLKYALNNDPSSDPAIAGMLHELEVIRKTNGFKDSNQ